MAVDPVTAKMLAQLAAQAATDKQAGKRLLIVILAPVLFLLLLIAFIVHLLTSPISMFVGWALGDGEVTAIKSFQQEYGYNQNIGIYDTDYINGSGQSYEGVVFTDGGMEVMYYNQLDERWADVMYGTSSTIGQGGCGPTSMAIVTSTLTGEAHDPVELAQWSVANGHRCEGNGSYHSLIPTAASAYGLSCERNLDAQGIVDAGGGNHERGAFYPGRAFHRTAGRDQRGEDSGGRPGKLWQERTGMGFIHYHGRIKQGGRSRRPLLGHRQMTGGRRI